jgi:hypothetical protein
MKDFTVANIIKKDEKIIPFGGINFVDKFFRTSGLSKLINKSLGNRVQYYGYTYEDIIRNLCNVFMCGGDCAEDINKHMKATLSQIPGNKVPSADTVLRIFDELSIKNVEKKSSDGKTYQFNINNKMNDMLIKSCLVLGHLTKQHSYDLDYDNQILTHNKIDAQKTYKKTEGYFPGVGAIGNNIVYIENRDGNTHVKFSQAETLKEMFKQLADNEIYVNRFRADAGSYSKEIIDVLSKNCNKFYIRANKCEELTSRIHELKDWEKVKINNKEYEVASFHFTSFFEERAYRLVVMREAISEDKQGMFPEYNYIYRSILTNDNDSNEKEVIEYYNKRGGSEKNFDVQNNDFGWRHLPCSYMSKNTVYLILTAIFKNFYNYIIKKVSAVFPDLQPTSRLKHFIFRFITVASQWIKKGGQLKLILYDTIRPYEKLVT